MSKYATLILLSAGASGWDEEKKIAGWSDIRLSEQGINQCKEAAYMLRGLKIDVAFTSYLKRGIHSTCIILDEMDINCVKIKKHWRLNPRHYGALQGLYRSEAKKTTNYEAVRVGLSERPPKLSSTDEAHPSYDLKYSLVPSNMLPSGESLIDTQDRIVPYWFDRIAPCLLKGKNVLVVSHRDTIKALRYFLKDDENDINSLEIASGIPRIYEFNEKLDIIQKKNLGDPEDIESRIRRFNLS